MTMNREDLVERLLRQVRVEGRPLKSTRLVNPDGPAAVDFIVSQAAELERRTKALELIADREAWRGFSPLPIVHRMRDIASAALHHPNNAEGERE